jgi:lysophospholipase L1-like esterase
MYWYEAEVAALEAKIQSGEIAKGAHLFYGSSSFRLWEGLKNDFPEHTIENIAFGGSTLDACVYFFERLVVPCQPRSLIFYAGDNDIGDGRYHTEIMASFETLLAKRAKYLPGVHFTFISIKPSPARFHLLHRIRLVNRYVKERFEELDNVTYLDLHRYMFTADGVADASLYLEDGLHLNTNGYALWREHFLLNATEIFH